MFLRRISEETQICRARFPDLPVAMPLSAIEVWAWLTGKLLVISPKSTKIFKIWVWVIKILNLLKTQKKLTYWTTILIIITWQNICINNKWINCSNLRNWKQFMLLLETLILHLFLELAQYLVKPKLACQLKLKANKLKIVMLINRNLCPQKGLREQLVDKKQKVKELKTQNQFNWYSSIIHLSLHK